MNLGLMLMLLGSLAVDRVIQTGTERENHPITVIRATGSATKCEGDRGLP